MKRSEVVLYESGISNQWSRVVVYKTLLWNLSSESTLNSKKCIRICSLRSQILMHFFKFKLNSNDRFQSSVLYTTYKLIKSNFIKISNSKKQIKTNFKHKKQIIKMVYESCIRFSELYFQKLKYYQI